MAILSGRVAVVTGGAKRVGRTICLLLADQAIHIIFTYRRSEAAAQQTLTEIEKKGVGALAVQADLTDLNFCDQLIAKSEDRFGKVDILINNASDFPRTPLTSLANSPDRFKEQFDELARLHMRTPLYLGIKFGLRMKSNGWGRIVNIVDRVTIKGQAYPNWILYIITKYGLYGINQALAEELKPEVTVNAVAPGLTLAPETLSEAQVQAIRDGLPLKHEVGPEEIAADVLHLIQSNSKTGSVILSDSGAGVHTY